jgi:hypothetical protein
MAMHEHDGYMRKQRQDNEKELYEMSEKLIRGLVRYSH